MRLLAGLAAAVALVVLVGCGGTASPAKTSATAAPRLSVLLPAEIRQKGRLEVGVKCDYPPFGYTDASGATVGYEIDMVRRMALYAFGDPRRVDLQCVVAANRIAFLTTGRVDMLVATLTYTPDRAKTIAFSDPYFSAAGRLLVARGSSIKEARNLAGKTVATITGSVYDTYLHNCVPGITVLTFQQTADGLAALKEGRVQAFMQDDTLLAGLVRTNSDLTIVGSGVAAGPWGVGLRQGDAALLAWVNAALAEMQKEDFDWKNFQRWVRDRSVQQKLAKSVPRPGQSLTYGQGPVTACAA
jgi:polar amino acid transport system substrate-binding protein